MFIPLIIWLLVDPAAAPGWFWFSVGFLPAYAVHLLWDMFPKKWAGGARISWYPLGGWRMKGILSFIWLAGGVAAAGAVFIKTLLPIIINNATQLMALAQYRLSLQ